VCTVTDTIPPIAITLLQSRPAAVRALIEEALEDSRKPALADL
jgi:hypothetical protein